MADPAPEDGDSILEDLLAPFDLVRMPEPAASPDDEPDADAERLPSPPPPPASARFPDAPPPATMTRTHAPMSDPAPDPAQAPAAEAPLLPPLPPAPPYVDVPVPDAESEPGEAGVADYRLRPPRPSAPPPGPAAVSAGIPESGSGPAPLPGLAPPPWSAAESAAAPPSAPASAPEAVTPTPASRPAAAPPAHLTGPALSRAHAYARTPKAAPPPAHSPRTTAARRAVGAVDLTPGPGAGRPFVAFARPALYDDSTTRLRPVRTWVQPRVTAAAACVVLGLGLIGGAATGSWLTGGAEGASASPNAYAVAGKLWHSVPVDQLFPATIKGEGAGPGGADRTWTRVAVAPDSTCKGAFDPLLRKALAPAGCLRLLRATYTDATRSHVTTVGLLFTKADADAMRSLRTRFTEEGLDRRPDLMPRPYAAKGTPAADFGDAQRASWTVSVLPDAPVVAFAVSGFADGRTVTEPEPADEAMKTSATSAPAQAGLGNEAKGIADRVERRLRKTIAATEKSS
ncbi:hypothetical protein GCM10009837_02410 [Streptomyces durmitorensis]